MKRNKMIISHYFKQYFCIILINYFFLLSQKKNCGKYLKKKTAAKFACKKL